MQTLAGWRSQTERSIGIGVESPGYPAAGFLDIRQLIGKRLRHRNRDFERIADFAKTFDFGGKRKRAGEPQPVIRCRKQAKSGVGAKQRADREGFISPSDGIIDRQESNVSRDRVALHSLG